MKLPKLPKPIPCGAKKKLLHGHTALHTIYWLHGIAEAPSIGVGVLYLLLCASTLSVAFLLEKPE